VTDAQGEGANPLLLCDNTDNRFLGVKDKKKEQNYLYKKFDSSAHIETQEYTPSDG
jgi:hypothetical protein